MIVITLRKDGLDGGWVAACPRSPAFAGCFGQGETRAEALLSIADAARTAAMERKDEES